MKKNDMSMAEIRTRYSNLFDFIYDGITENDIDTKIQKLKNASGVTNIHAYGGNETKEEILEILEYNYIMEKL